MTPPRDKRGAIADPADAERAEHPDSFDPGPETGYLRRGHRDHDLELDGGGAPFDPGPDHYDDRRAKRVARRRAKAERKRLKRERAERAARENEQRRRRERAAARAEAQATLERRKREQGVRAEQERALLAQREARRQAEAKPSERTAAERERLRREDGERTARTKRTRKRAKRSQLPRRKRAAGGAERTRSPGLRPAPGPAPAPPPRLADDPAHVSLRLPTLKAGVALAAVTGLAAIAGSALGLPVPGLGGDSTGESSALTGSADAAALAFLDGGTPVGLSKGPYHPVVGQIGYGESAAKFGASRGGRSHEGQDVFAKPGSPLVAVRAGEVVDESPEGGRYSGGRGNYVVIYSQLDGRSYVYLHLLKRALVRKGDSVAAGQPIGQVGCSGSCDGPHLHFEVRNGRQTLRAKTKPVNPLPLLAQWPQVPLPGRG